MCSILKTDYTPSMKGFSNEQISDPNGSGVLRDSAGGANAPGDAADLTDTAVRARKQAAALQLMSGRGRRSMFSSGPYGSAFTSNNSILGGQ